MSLYDILLAPFLVFIKQLFLFSYEITGNYGVSILLLSFSVSALLLPVFVFIERAKKKDNAIKLRMNPVADEIKRCYKGQERHYYLKTLNRQHGYKPLHALIPILSLLLQIPFFIAAYQFLEAYEPLNGVAFGFISDLSKPDALFGSINFLPIAMTLVNLLTAWFYTRHGEVNERRQMVIVAAVFLVLLFNLPSGLVLYWTMNNVFSFFRLFITNPEVFKKKTGARERTKPFLAYRQRVMHYLPKLYFVALIATCTMLLIQIHWVLNNEATDVFLRVTTVILTGPVFMVLSSLVLALYKVDINLKETPFKELLLKLWGVFRNTFFTFVILFLIPQINWALSHDFNDFGVRIILALLIAFAGIALLATAILELKHRFAGAYLKKLRVSKTVVLSTGAIILVYTISQINWCLQYGFSTFVPRLVIGSTLIWGIVVFARFIIRLLSKNPRLTVSSLKQIVNKSALFLLVSNILLVIFLYSWAYYSLSIQEGNAWILKTTLSAIVLIFILNLLFFFIKSLKLWKEIIQNSEVIKHIILVLLFIGAYLFLSADFYFSGEYVLLKIIGIFIIILSQCLSILYWHIKMQKQVVYAQKWPSILPFAVFSFQLVVIIARIFSKVMPDVFVIPDWALESGLLFISVIAGVLFSLGVVLIPGQNTFKVDNTIPVRIHIVVLLSMFYLVGFVFFWSPLSVFSSYPSNFEFAAIDILKHNFKPFFLSLSVGVLIYAITSKRFGMFWPIFTITLVVLAFANSTLIPIDVGSLQENKYVGQENLAQPIFKYFLELLFIILVIVFIRKLLHKRKEVRLIQFVILLNVVLIAKSLYDAKSSGAFLEKKTQEISSNSSISFSKDKPNVVFIITDMFHGWYMNRIIQEEPELSDSLEGFVWYPNTLSVSNLTSSSIAPILGGADYTIDKLNKDSRSLQEKITELTVNFRDKVKSNGYDFTSSQMIYSTIDKSTFDAFLPKWHDDWNTHKSVLNIGLTKEVGYSLLWQNALFYSVPLAIKPRIYNEGQWLEGEIETNENNSYTKPYNFLRILPYISNAENEDPSFIYLHTYASHHPWDLILEDGKLKASVTPYENNKWTIETFTKWLSWMKGAGVYDNTKIVLLSDHGPHWGHYKGDVDMDIPLKSVESSSFRPEHIMAQFALLMVKDFNKTGPLQTNWQFMSNMDAPAIAFDENDPTKHQTNTNRELPASVVQWERKLWLNSELEVVHSYVVKENIYDLKNWTKLK